MFLLCEIENPDKSALDYMHKVGFVETPTLKISYNQPKS